MPITITENSKELVSRLIRTEFDKVDRKLDYIYNKSEQLISTAREFGLSDLAEEMSNDLQLA